MSDTDLQHLIAEIANLGDRVETITDEIAILKNGIAAIEASNQNQDTQLQAVDTALSALKVARENKQAVKSLAEDFRDTSEIAAARIVALERLSALTLRTVRAFLTAALGYLLLQWATDRWATISLLDDKLADWLSMAAIACFAWASVVISNKEQWALDRIQSLPFFRR